MPQILALEWDLNEARIAVANSRGDRAVIERAFSVDLRPGPATGDAAEEKVDIGKRIAAALSTHGIGRMETLVAVGRASIELRQLTLPPAPDDELPEMARFQAMREFGQFDEDWLLDFLPLDEETEELAEPREVLAAAISPGAVKQIQQNCSTAGLTPKRLVLRSCAAASLLAKADPLTLDRPRLLIELLGADAELTVMLGGKVHFLRTTRLGNDPVGNPDQQKALLSEIRRTLAAAENQLGGQRIESLALCGSGKAFAELAEMIDKELGRPTKLFDPFASVTLGGKVSTELPEYPGRFAPLLGMAISEIEQTSQGIDFLNPRKRPEPPSQQNRYVLIAAAVVLLIIAFGGWRMMEKKKLEATVEKLEKDKANLAKKLEKVEADVKTQKVLAKWEDTDVIWLDELYELSENMPPAKQIVIKKFEARQLTTKGGKIDISGLAEGVPAVKEVSANLNTEKRTVIPGSRIDQDEKGYTLQFNAAINLGTEKK